MEGIADVREKWLLLFSCFRSTDIKNIEPRG